MKIFKSRMSIELERLSAALDARNNAFVTSLKSHSERLDTTIDFIALEHKLKEIAEQLKKKNVFVVFNSESISDHFDGGICIKTADFSDEIKNIGVFMDKLTKKRIAIAIVSLSLTTIGLWANHFIDNIYVLGLAPWSGFSTLLIGQLFLIKPERKLTADVINLRVRKIKDANRLRAVAAEIDKGNQFLKERLSDIKSSVETITQLFNSGRYDKALKDEFIVVNAVLNQVLYHIDKDKVKNET